MPAAPRTALRGAAGQEHLLGLAADEIDALEGELVQVKAKMKGYLKELGVDA